MWSADTWILSVLQLLLALNLLCPHPRSVSQSQLKLCLYVLLSPYFAWGLVATQHTGLLPSLTAATDEQALIHSGNGSAWYMWCPFLQCVHRQWNWDWLTSRTLLVIERDPGPETKDCGALNHAQHGSKFHLSLGRRSQQRCIMIKQTHERSGVRTWPRKVNTVAVNTSEKQIMEKAGRTLWTATQNYKHPRVHRNSYTGTRG